MKDSYGVEGDAGRATEVEVGGRAAEGCKECGVGVMALSMVPWDGRGGGRGMKGGARDERLRRPMGIAGIFLCGRAKTGADQSVCFSGAGEVEVS